VRRTANGPPRFLSVWVQVYNTSSSEGRPAEDVQGSPRPQLEGKLGIEAKNQDWFASVVDVMGGGEKGLQFSAISWRGTAFSARTGIRCSTTW